MSVRALFVGGAWDGKKQIIEDCEYYPVHVLLDAEALHVAAHYYKRAEKIEPDITVYRLDRIEE